MTDLEQFLHDKSERTPALLKAAFAHVQFETIHPFLDGNGRVGRLMITLLLVSEGVLQEPLLYLSLYFNAHREIYYDLLQRVRTDGDWEAWISFFMRGVKQTAEHALATARQIATLFTEDRGRIESLGRVASSVLQVHDVLRQNPIQSINTARQRTGLTAPTVAAAMRSLEVAGIVRELTGKLRGRVFAYDRYLGILNEGTTMTPER